MSLPYSRGDELPEWVPTITVNGTAPNFVAGWTFTVTLTGPSTTVTKTTGITGAAGGLVTVAWASGNLDITPGTWLGELTATRTSDGAQLTIREQIEIRPRALAGP